jgi:hypothetical protein
MQHEIEGDAIRWLSYAQLGEMRGTSPASAKRFANRKHWRKQRGNDGTVRVAVPEGGTVPRETVRGTAPGQDRDRAEDRLLLPQALAALETALSKANERAGAALALADKAMAQAADAEAEMDAAAKRAERAEAQIGQERLAADRYRSEAEAATTRAGQAEVERDQERLAADRLRGEAEAARGELAQAVEQRTAAEERAHHLGLELTAEKAIRSAADDEVERLRQAENARQQLGRWRRAWRGWRGR